MTRKVDFFSGIAFLVLAVLVWLGADAMPKADMGMGAGGYPKFLAVCIGIMGILLSVRAYVGMKQNPGEKDAKRLDAKELLYAGALVVSFLVYTMVVKSLGYMLATIIFFIIFMLIYGERRPKVLFGVSIPLSIGIYFLFEKVFLIMLPNGFIGI